MSTLLGKLEQKTMDIIWESKGSLKPAEVKEKLGGNLAYTTVMTVLKRLCDKKLLTRYKSGNHYCYYAKQKKEDFAEDRLGNVFKNIMNSFGDLAISQFIDTIKSDPSDLKLLKKYLDEIDKK